jgi:multiple sugar transport system permease protein
MFKRKTLNFGELGILEKLNVYLLLLLGLVLFLFPLLWMLSTSLKTLGKVQKLPMTWIPDPFMWVNYVEVFQAVPFLRYIWNTVWYTGTSVFLAVFASSLAAFAFARLRARGRTMLFVFVLSTMMIPPQVTMIPQYLLFNQLNWVDSYLPLIVPSIGGSAFLIFLLRQFYLGISKELDEAVKIDGGGYTTLYFKIILPLSLPACATAAILEFMYRWNDLIGPLIYIQSGEKYLLALALANFTAAYGATPWNLLMAASVISVIIPLIIFFSAQKYFIQGIVISGSKG